MVRVPDNWETEVQSLVLAKSFDPWICLNVPVDDYLSQE